MKSQKKKNKYLFFKRLFDISFSLFFLILFSPLFLLLSVLIKFSSRGPVIFKQRRIGKNEKEFIIYKFRTLTVLAPPDVETKLLTEKDKYLTKIGVFLRKTSLDELPQLVNILKGEMSFVGPRPALYNQYTLIEKRRENGVNLFRPGLTGLAQCNGRESLSLEEKVSYDAKYVKECHMFLDIKIIFKTISIFIEK